jgi:hypothetical protein
MAVTSTTAERTGGSSQHAATLTTMTTIVATVCFVDTFSCTAESLPL